MFDNCFSFRYLGSLNISRISLKGVESAISKNMDEKTEYKGVKAHFKMDENGILNLDEVYNLMFSHWVILLINVFLKMILRSIYGKRFFCIVLSLQ